MSNFSKISKILQDAKRGKLFVLVDDEGRENEGDLIIPASKITAKTIPAITVLFNDCKILDTFTSNKLNIIL